MKALGVIALCCVCLVVGYAGAVQVWDKKAKQWQENADSLTTEVKVWKAETTRLLRVATAPDTVRLPARRPVPIPSTTVPDSRTVTLETFDSDSALIDTLLREQAVLHDRIGRDSVKLAAFARVVARDTVLIDSLTALVGRAPIGKPRGINLLGLRLCPVVGVGYALLGTGQHGPALTITQPLSCD